MRSMQYVMQYITYNNIRNKVFEFTNRFICIIWVSGWYVCILNFVIRC